ncbi:MAG: acyltransferase [Pseudomonadales bacterium]|nr:acyltransferase [Pseudomonadales bacterium]
MKKRIDDIEVLRAFAVILVIVEHMHFNLFAWNTPALESFYRYFGGWTGVDLFFAISGFVIARDLVPRLRGAGDRQAYVGVTLVFWVRRCWRLLPSAWTWLAIILLASVFFNRSGAWGSVTNNVEMVVAAALQIANFHVARVFGEAFSGAAFVYWSLSLEEQFYLLLPLLVFVSRGKLPLLLAALVIPQLFLQRDTALLALVRTDALFLGVLLALWQQYPSYRLFRPRFLRHPAASVAAVLLLVGALALVGAPGLEIIEYGYALVTCLAGLLVFIASHDQDYFARPRWLRAPLLWVGTRSYALYLIHIPSYFLTREIWLRLEPAGTRFNAAYTWEFLATALVLLLALSELNYRVLEVPLRRRGVAIAQKMETRRLAARAAAAAASSPA